MTDVVEPRWIREDVVRAIHARQLAEHGGAAGLRDDGLLSSALHRPLQLWQYGDPRPDAADLAAAYAHGLASNHPFVDGNKRTAFVLCRLFLLLNGYDLEASRGEKVAVFLDLAAGKLSQEDVAVWIRERVVEVEPG